MIETFDTSTTVHNVPAYNTIQYHKSSRYTIMHTIIYLYIGAIILIKSLMIIHIIHTCVRIILFLVVILKSTYMDINFDCILRSDESDLKRFELVHFSYFFFFLYYNHVFITCAFDCMHVCVCLCVFFLFPLFAFLSNS